MKENGLWATTHYRSFLTVLKSLMGLWAPGSESGLPGFKMGITLVDFQAKGKYPKRSWVRAMWERFRSMVAERPSVPGADLVLRDWIRCWSSNGFVSWASVTCGWGRQKYLLTGRFTMHAMLAVPTIKLRWRVHSKRCARRLALSAKLKTYTPWPNKGGTGFVGVVKYLAIFQNNFAWVCNVPRKEDHLEFCSWVCWEVRTQRCWWRRWKRQNPDLDTNVSNRFWVSCGSPDLGGK